MENLECDSLDALDEYWAEEYEQDYVKPSSDSKFNFIDAFDKAKIIAIILIALLAFNLLPVGISRANTGTLNTTDKPETTINTSSSAASDYLTSNTINESNVTSVKAANEPPQIKGSLNAGGFVNEPFTWNYSFYVSDPDGDEITATSDDPHITWDGLVATFNYSDVGDYPVKLTFVDSHGANVSGTGIIKIVERRENEFIRAAHGGELKDSNGHIDVNKTIEALKKVYANAIVLEPAYDKQWEDILNFLPAANENNIKVFLILPDARRGVCSPGETAPDPDASPWYCDFPKPYGKNYVNWIEELANLSLEYPVFEGVFIDDFEHGIPIRKYSSGYAGFTIEYIKEVMQAKNRINPNFKFLPGIYLSRGLSDFIIYFWKSSEGGYAMLSTTINYPGIVNNASLKLITHPIGDSQYDEQILINNKVVYDSSLEGIQLVKTVDLTPYDLSNTDLKYKFIIHNVSSQYPQHWVTPLLSINGEKIETEWIFEKKGSFSYEEYYDKIKPYYDLTDGAIFWSNFFDLIEPENEVVKEVLDIAKERVGKNKVIFGHFYGAEPWKEPVFPSDYYFDTFAKINFQKTDGVKPWYAFLLPYYLNYSSGIYSQPENDNPSYDFRFHYPVRTSSELGFYHGIKTEIALPESISDANISFKVTDDRSKPTLKWVKELVIKTGEFEQNFSCRSDESCLWFRENKTIWWDSVGSDGVEQQISEDLLSYISPGEKITLVLRMRADMFYPPGMAHWDVNVYVTKPKIMINGEEVHANWSFVSGNALESLWLKSSEHIKELFREIALGPPGTLIGTVSSAGNPIPNATVTAGEYETLTNESGSYHMKLPPGTYTVTASAEGYEPASENVTIAPGNNKTLNFSLSPPSLPHTVYGFVFLHNGTTPAVGVDVTLAHEQGNLSTCTASDGSYTFDLGNLPSYNDNDRLQITASSGESFASANITVNTSVEPQKAPDLVLNIPPSISLTSPASGALINSSSVTLQWTSSDDDGDALSHTVILDGSSYDAGSSSSYTLALADGTHTWKVVVSDSFVSVESATRTFTIDTTPPVVTIDPVTSPTSSTTQTISGSFIETGSGIARITVNGIPAEISGTTFYANISLSEGENIITVIATDKAGNSDSQSTSIILLKSASISLAKAWNLLSLPLNLSIDAETFGKKANATCIVAWNNTAKSYTSHVVGTASNLFDMKTGHGYWVSYPDTCGNVQIDGLSISNVTYDLKRGWNLIGSMNGTAEEICSALGSSSITIWDEASQKYISHVAGLMSNNFNITRSEGCWVWVDSDTTIVV